MGLRSTVGGALREVLRTAAGRPSESERLLGTGVWRRLHDRSTRALDRYHQVVDPVPPGLLREELDRAGARLVACWESVRAQCAAAQARWPSAGLDIPGGEARDVHARLSRAATQVAQAAEAATMARLRGSGAAAVDRAVDQVEALVAPR